MIHKVNRTCAWYLLIPVILVCVFVAGCRQPEIKSDERASKSMTLISFNVRYNNPDDGENAWPYRKERVAALLQFHQADLAGLQEVLNDQLNDLTELMPGFGWFGVGRTDGQTQGEYAPIFYKRSRFSVQKSGTFWLSESSDVPSKGWDAALNRIVTWGALKDRLSDQLFYIFNTHFDHAGLVAREKSAALLLEKIEAIAGSDPVLITGDFNFISSEHPYQILTDTQDPLHVRDAFGVSKMPHYGPVSSYGGGFDEACKEGKKIDYIFVRNQVGVLRHAILSDSWAGICPSDHMPVFSEIILKP